MSKSEVLEKIKSIISENDYDKGINVSTISEKSEFVRDLGLNSMEMIYSVVVIEKEFNCRITNEEYRNIKTVGDVIDLIIRKEESDF